MALSNDFKVLTWIANRGLSFLVPNFAFIECGQSETYGPEFDNREYAKGDNIQIRRSNRRIGGEGTTISLDGVVEKTENLTIERQFNDGLVFSTKEQALFMSGEEGMEIYAERYIKPSILRLTAQINSYLAQKASTDLYNHTGSVGTPINSFATLANVRAKMANLNMPIDSEESYMIVTPDDDAALKSSLPNLFIPTTNERVVNKYFLNSIAEFTYHSTSTVDRHIAGSAGGATGLAVKTAVSSGNTIVIKGFSGAATKVFKKGDKITIDGSYKLAPVTYAVTNQKAQFVVTADADSNASGEATITVSPEIIIDATNPFRNFSAQLAADAPVTVLATHNSNVAFTKGGFSYAMPKMQKMWLPYSTTVTDTEFGTGISLRLSKGADITNDQNIMRWDVLVGARFWPEYGFVIAS
jgi:hypothetical protein